jgi:hypothetical protein
MFCTQFCPQCFTPATSNARFCPKCRGPLDPLEPKTTASRSELIPLSHYSFLRRRRGEAEHAIRYCDVRIERSFENFNLHFDYFSHLRPIEYKVPVLLVTNQRILFLASDEKLLSLSTWRRKTDERYIGTEVARTGRGKSRRYYHSPYWVLDSALNDELDQEFKVTLHLQGKWFFQGIDSNSPYDDDKASRTWTEVWRRPQLVKSYLAFELRCVLSDAHDPGYEYRGEGSAKLFMQNRDELEELNAMLGSIFSPDNSDAEKCKSSAEPFNKTTSRPDAANTNVGSASRPWTKIFSWKFILTYYSIIALCVCISSGVFGEGRFIRFIGGVGIITVLSMTWYMMRRSREHYGVKSPPFTSSPIFRFFRRCLSCLLVLSVIGMVIAFAIDTQKAFPHVSTEYALLSGSAIAILVWVCFYKFGLFRSLGITALILLGLLYVYDRTLIKTGYLPGDGSKKNTVINPRPPAAR